MIKVIPCLNEILKEKKMTQMELSALSGVPQGSISRFDKNKSHDDSHLFAIARALGLNVEQLFKIEE
ncbi:helix-turn-helix domain-containing protein [Paenibacillus tianmuensis]|uniref:helix-turn-helix domain-containing protein n=1 Tax=Paenibacillus tianmuensis TaxID=624147 RepID=UPI000A4EF5B9|nr:helix-turn-helix transcriptional regulator [Paenibacillus tianmuensis]